MEEIKEKASKYALKNDKLWNFTLNTPVVFTAEELKEIIKAVHKDLGHYGKKPTLEAVRKRYDVARELWKEGKKVLKSCVPCQLYKRVPNFKDTVMLHSYGIRKPFSLWEIDFVGKLTSTPRGNRYLITAIDYATSRTMA